jgi:hypothetical protein
VRIPNAEQAIIEPEKITLYLLNIEHKRGGDKAVLLNSFGYSMENWPLLVDDLRLYHLTVDVTLVRDTPYGQRYEVRAPLVTPSGPLTNCAQYLANRPWRRSTALYYAIS